MARFPSKRIAIIGAGISGVTTAAHLKSEGLDATVFERSSVAGGVWVYDERKPIEPLYPSTLASQADGLYTDTQTNKAEVEQSDTARLQHSPPGPCYVGLTNNVPTRLLETTLNSFPSGTPDFVNHSVLETYIQDTAQKTGVNDITIYDTEVKNVQKRDKKWIVETVTLGSNDTTNIYKRRTIWEFDAVVVASGHYHAARVPNIHGLSELKKRWPNRVRHSKGYRTPDAFKGKNILLVGASVSSTDIARELGPIANQIYQVHRNGAFDLPASLLPPNATRVSEIESFDLPQSHPDGPLPDERSIPATITLKGGQKLCDIHHIVLCTGYHVFLPFLRYLHSDNTPIHLADEKVLVTDGTQRHNLHKDIFYIPDPTLIFVGVPYFTATFTLFEFQAMVVAKVLSGKVRLPEESLMRAEYRNRVEKKGFGKGFHSLKDREIEYVDELLAWVNGDLEKQGQERLKGHTEAWKELRKEQMERIKAMFTGKNEPDRELTLVC